MADIADLVGQYGVKTISGHKVKLYAVCACDIETWPAYKTTTGVGDSITLDGDIVLKAGKKWAVLETIVDTGKLTETEVGEVGSQVIQSMYELKFPKTIASDEWVSKTPNVCTVLLIEDKDGKKRLIGSKDVPAIRTAAVGVNGALLTDAKNWAFTYTANTGDVAPYYESDAAIDLTGA